MFRRFSLAATGIVIVAAVGVSTVNSPAASAQPAQPPANPPAVISLGDSYISGEAGRWQGNGNTLRPGSRYGTDRAAYDCNAGETWCWHDPERVYGASYGNGCNRSNGAEITHLARVRVGTVDHTIASGNRFNVACSGATTAAIDRRPFKGEPEQADQLARYARSADIKLVALSIGGNDINFADMIQACVVAYTTNSTHCNQTLAPELPQRLERMKTRVTRAINSIRTTMTNAGYPPAAYRFVLQSYPSPIPRAADNRYPESGWSRLTDGGCPFFNDDSDWANGQLVTGVADALSSVADATGVEFLDMRRAIRGHEVCARGVEQSHDGNTLVTPLPKAQSEWARWIGVPGVGQGETQEFMHPNHYGQQELGRCLSTMAARPVGNLNCSRPG